MRKRVWLIVILVCTIICLNGCVVYFKDVNDIDSWMFCFHGKSDPMTDFGKRTAYADGRIWYLSSECGKQGLHSMAENGTDVRLEFQTEDIRSLTIRDGTIWTAEYVGKDENDCGEFRNFGLFVRRGGANAPPENLLAEIDDKTRKDVIYGDENILDLYVMPNETVYFRCAQIQLPQGRRVTDLFVLQNGEISAVSDWDYSVQIEPLQDSIDTIYSNEIAVKWMEDHLLFRDDGGNCMVYDLDKGRIGFEIDNRYDYDFFSVEEPMYSERVLVGMREDRLFFVGAQELLALQPKTVQAERWAITDEHESICATYDMGDRVFLLTKHWKREKQLFDEEWSAKSKTLYRLNLETGEREQMLSVEHPAEFVYLSDRYTATAEGKTLTLYDISGETVEKIREIELEHEIVDKSNKTDCAGGWWFLYRFNEETNRDELIEKVRLY